MENISESENRKEKKQELFRNQKHTPDLFPERGAISREQYDKSLGDLILKMGIERGIKLRKKAVRHNDRTAAGDTCDLP